jgi:protein TonB
MLGFICFPIVSSGQQHKKDNILESEKIYEMYQCEEKASFPGGDSELIKYIAEHVNYQEISEQPDHELMYIKFVITKSGKIGKITLIRSLHPKIDEEVICVIKSLPKWNPSRINKKPVNSWFVVPLRLHFQ